MEHADLRSVNLRSEFTWRHFEPSLENVAPILIIQLVTAGFFNRLGERRHGAPEVTKFAHVQTPV